MKAFRGFLLPIAVLLAGVVVFEFGARYGAANVRATGIAGELAFPLNLYVQAGDSLDAAQRENLEFLIDYRIAAGAVHRDTWYLGRKSTDALNKVLAYAISIRGDAAIQRFEPSEEEIALMREENGEAQAQRALERMAELRAAVVEAKRELVDEAPDQNGVTPVPAALETEATVEDLVQPAGEEE